VRDNLCLIEERGFQRHQDLMGKLEGLIENTGT
jgi:hypothetical protein